MYKLLSFAAAIFCGTAVMPSSGYGQSLESHQKSNLLNPILPGYFADPTVKKIDDTYYIYATTDGNGWGAGPSQVWTSKDFLNWTIQPMNWPNTHWYWAPDMTKGYDNRYYLYYSQPVEIFGAVSDSPVGPWEPLAAEGKAIIPNYLIPGVITLDAQTFTDDDGKIYMFWGTWGIYPDHGCAVGILNKDMKSFEKVELIPNTVAKDFFEAPIMFKREGIYYMMYSSGHCEDHTYRVQYVKSSVGPMGPFEYPSHNPILVTNEDGTIHGPGHHSVLEENGRYYIVYHRHNNPHSGGGFHRQVAVDEMFFDANGDIVKVKPTHEGVSALIKANGYPKDLAFEKKVAASSYYNNDFRPSFALDNNNGTLWRAKENDAAAWISIDLEDVKDVETVEIQFEYPTYAYQYKIETSIDGQQWTTFVDQSQNNRWASPILEHAKVKARYLRLTILDTQMPGLPRGIWNMKVYGQRLAKETLWSSPQTMPTQKQLHGNLVHLDASAYEEGQWINTISNKGALQGEFKGERSVLIKNHQGRKAFYFDGKSALKSTMPVPQSMAGNSPYTISMWINNPAIDRYENVLAWSTGNQDLTKAMVGYGADPQRGAITHGAWPDMGFAELPAENKWHHMVFTFDGYMERIYIDGKLLKEGNKMLFVKPGEHFVLGASDVFADAFSGYIADLKVYTISLSEEERLQDMTSHTPSPFIAIQSDALDLGTLTAVRNHGVVADQSIALVGASVQALGGRTAIKAKQIKDVLLSNYLAGPQYTVEFDAFDGRTWNHIVAVKTKAVTEVFINGKPSTVKQLEKSMRRNNEGLTLTNPFHFLRVEQEPIPKEEIINRYKRWEWKRNDNLTNLTVSLLKTPSYINNKHVFLQVDEARSGLFYNFSSKDRQSGWIKEPYYLFDSLSQGDSIAVVLKDEFGNLSPILSTSVVDGSLAAIQPPKEQLFDSDADGQLPFWTGYAFSQYADSTKSRIQADGTTWRISSRNTKWGNKDLAPPFLYQELEGDFTIQVKVKDLVGLSQRSRTSNEVGIMLRPKGANKISYVTNTVLTGWNLGNLSRSVGAGVFQEGNTGKGLDFAPYLQVQKAGDYFFLRYSYDGQQWQDLPNSPFRRVDLGTGMLQVGLYQLSGNNQDGYAVFEAIRVFQ